MNINDIIEHLKKKEGTESIEVLILEGRYNQGNDKSLNKENAHIRLMNIFSALIASKLYAHDKCFLISAIDKIQIGLAEFVVDEDQRHLDYSAIIDLLNTMKNAYFIAMVASSSEQLNTNQIMAIME